MDPGAKELLSNHLAIVLGQCTPKVSRQDVLVNLLEEAVEVISVNKDLQESEQGKLSGRRREEGRTKPLRAVFA